MRIISITFLKIHHEKNQRSTVCHFHNTNKLRRRVSTFARTHMHLRCILINGQKLRVARYAPLLKSGRVQLMQFHFSRTVDSAYTAELIKKRTLIYGVCLECVAYYAPLKKISAINDLHLIDFLSEMHTCWIDTCSFFGV